MAVTRQHRVPYPEVLDADELPAGVPAPARPVATRDAAGRFRPGAGTRELARLGGEAAHEADRLRQLLGLSELAEDHPYAPYARLAREWRDDHMRQLAATVAGGEVGPGPASVVSTAALQLGASRYLHDLGVQSSDPKLLLDASRLADASRQSLLAAHELAAREAAARPRDPAAAHRAALAAFMSSSSSSSAASPARTPPSPDSAPARGGQ